MLSVYYMHCSTLSFLSFFFNDTATTEIYTLSLHDALPISVTDCQNETGRPSTSSGCSTSSITRTAGMPARSEEHTSELQSHSDLVCRLLLEKKKNINRISPPNNVYKHS